MISQSSYVVLNIGDTAVTISELEAKGLAKPLLQDKVTMASNTLSMEPYGIFISESTH